MHALIFYCKIIWINQNFVEIGGGYVCSASIMQNIPHIYV
jgi:hypothetical protein